VIAGRFSAENFQKSSTALNRQWPLNFTDTPTKTNSKSFTISLIEIGLQMSPSLGPVSRHLLNSILDIEFTRLTVVVLVPLGLDLDYFLPKLLFPILISSYTAVIQAVLDFATWAMNLTAANLLGPSVDPVWFELYQMKQEYQLDDLSPNGMSVFFRRMLVDDALFQRYFQYAPVIRSVFTQLRNE
jgi:hypothetical protein